MEVERHQLGIELADQRVDCLIEPDGATASFLPVYATTLLEGFILSFLLLMIAFFALVFLQMRDRRRAFAIGVSP